MFFHTFLYSTRFWFRTCVSSVFCGLLILALDAFIFFPFNAKERAYLLRFSDMVDVEAALLAAFMVRSVDLVLYDFFPDFTKVVSISRHVPFFL